MTTPPLPHWLTQTLPSGAVAPPGSVVASIIALLVAAILVGVFARRLKLPYTVSLVVVGLALHGLGLVPEVHLTQDLLLYALLPALLFEAAIHLPGKDLKRYAPSIALLAVPGVLVAALATALVLQLELFAAHRDPAIPFVELLLFGAMIAATDPISVVALFKQLGVERRLALLVEGESLFNDGTAVVVFGILLDVLRTGVLQGSTAITTFVVVAVGGVIVGSAVGLLASWATGLFDDHLIEIALTVVTAYGAFLLAEQIHVSGVLATVFAGLLVGNVGKHRGMSPHTRVSVLSFWEFAVFLINSLVFLMIGLEVDMAVVLARWDIVLMAFFAVLAARGLTVFAPIPFLRRVFSQPIDHRVGLVLWWGGLRGGLSMVLALALPKEVSARSEIIAMTFGVVVLSVIFQGGTMGWLLKRLGLTAPRTEAMRFLGVRLARLKAIRAKQAALSDIVEQTDLDLLGLRQLRDRLEAERGEIVGELDQRASDPDFVAAATEHAAVVTEHLCEVGRDVYRAAHDDNLIDGAEAAHLFAGVENGDPSDGLSGPPHPQVPSSDVASTDGGSTPDATKIK